MTRGEFEPFFKPIYSLEAMQARFTVVSDLVRYVLRGCENQFHTEQRHPRAAAFQNAIYAMMADYMARIVEIKPAVRKRLPIPDIAECVITAFEDMQKFRGLKIGATPSFSDRELADAFSLRFNVVPIYGSLENIPSVDGAYQMALRNFQQAETRQIALAVIHELTRWSRHSADEPPGLAELNETLYTKRRGYLMDIATFGGLLGGKAAKDAVKLLANNSCYDPASHCNYSTIQFLQEDGMIPGRYMAAVSDGLAADIKAKYEAL